MTRTTSETQKECPRKCDERRIVSGGAYCDHKDGSGFCDERSCPRIEREIIEISLDEIQTIAERIITVVKKGRCDIRSLQHYNEVTGEWDYTGPLDKARKEGADAENKRVLDEVWTKGNAIATGSTDDREYSGTELKVPLAGIPSLYSIIESLRAQSPKKEGEP